MEISRIKRLLINMTATFLSFFTNIGVSFFVVPYIVKRIGPEAYGYVGLSNNFVSYAAVLTIALSSMVSRYITVSIHQKNMKKANIYFNSSIFSSVLFILLLSSLSIIFIININRIINIPTELLVQIKFLFAFTFLNFFISIINSPFSVSTFALNRLDISSIRDIISNVIRIFLLCYLFFFFKPSVAYLSISTAVSTFFILVSNIYFLKRFLPSLRIKLKSFSIKAIIEIVSSGMWNTITRLSQLLLNGLDLLIVNIFIGAKSMGILAISNTIPLFISSFTSTLGNLFLPQLTIFYAQKNEKELLKYLKYSMKIMNSFISIPISMLIIFGDVFYSLWMPNQNASLLMKLSIVVSIGLMFSGPINSIYAIFTITNKLKLNSFLLLISGTLNILIVLVLLKTTNLGIFAVAGVSTVLEVIREVTFLPLYGARLLKVRWYTFYPEIFKSILSVLLISGISYLIKITFEINSWTGLIISIGTCSIVGFLLNILVNFSNDERKLLFGKLYKKYRGKYSH